MFGLLASMFSVGAASKVVDQLLPDDNHEKKKLLEEYQPGKIARRFIAIMYTGSYLLWVNIGMVLIAIGRIEEGKRSIIYIHQVLGESLIYILAFYFGMSGIAKVGSFIKNAAGLQLKAPGDKK